MNVKKHLIRFATLSLKERFHISSFDLMVSPLFPELQFSCCENGVIVTPKVNIIIGLLNSAFGSTVLFLVDGWCSSLYVFLSGTSACPTCPPV